jgi:two-component system, chemotaxis family, chemotaxis protein CheY
VGDLPTHSALATAPLPQHPRRTRHGHARRRDITIPICGKPSTSRFLYGGILGCLDRCRRVSNTTYFEIKPLLNRFHPSLSRIAATPTDRETAVDTSLSVLVIDDFRSMSGIITKILRQIGFADVDEAQDGASALQSLKRKPYGLVISDWEMRPMTGPELVQALRQESGLAEIPVILVTTASTRSDEAKLCGADGFLTKPFMPAALKNKIAEVLGARVDAQT